MSNRALVNVIVKVAAIAILCVGLLGQDLLAQSITTWGFNGNLDVASGNPVSTLGYFNGAVSQDAVTYGTIEGLRDRGRRIPEAFTDRVAVAELAFDALKNGHEKIFTEALLDLANVLLHFAHELLLFARDAFHFHREFLLAPLDLSLLGLGQGGEEVARAVLHSLVGPKPGSPNERAHMN